MENQTPKPSPTPPTENIPVQNPAVAQTPSSQVYTAPHIDNPPPKKPFLTGKIILIIIILSVILSAGGTYLALNSKPKPQPTVPKVTPTTTPTPVDETANWKMLTNDRFHFSFKYPDQVFKYANSSSPSAEQFFLNGTVDKKPTPASFSIYVAIGPEFGMYKTIESYADYETRSTKDSKQENTEIGGAKAIRISTNPTLLEAIPSRSSYEYIFKKDGIIYFFSINGNKPDVEKNKPLLDQILSTFKFTEISPTPTCRPRPACLDATPRCLIPETPDMCRPSATPPPGGGGVVCTQDAKLCPDGKTYVGRQGPNCEFVACPGQ